MKLKKWMLWLLVLTFLASEVLLFSALRQKSTLQVSLQAEKQKTEQLQAQLDDLKNSNAEAQGAEVARLRAENQDLPRLRNQVTQLMASNQKLTQQLNDASAYVQQQQSQVQQLTAAQQAQAQQLAAAQQAQAETAARNACINNLRMYDAAKQQWALEKNKPANAHPAAEDLMPYFKDGVLPVCPSGGTYTLNAVDELPSCSIPGHVLPQ